MLTLQARRFLVSGAFATCVHVAVAAMCVEWVHAAPALANAIAFAVATVVSYVINTLWSFSVALDAATLARFVVVQMFGVALAALVSGGIDSLGAHYLIGIVCVPLFVTPVTYNLHKLWTYRRQPAPRDGSSTVEG